MHIAPMTANHSMAFHHHVAIFFESKDHLLSFSQPLTP